MCGGVARAFGDRGRRRDEEGDATDRTAATEAAEDTEGRRRVTAYRLGPQAPPAVVPGDESVEEPGQDPGREPKREPGDSRTAEPCGGLAQSRAGAPRDAGAGGARREGGTRPCPGSRAGPGPRVRGRRVNACGGLPAVEHAYTHGGILVARTRQGPVLGGHAGEGPSGNVPTVTGPLATAPPRTAPPRTPPAPTRHAKGPCRCRQSPFQLFRLFRGERRAAPNGASAPPTPSPHPRRPTRPTGP